MQNKTLEPYMKATGSHDVKSPQPYTKSTGSHDVKSPKKIKIIDCNNRNINAEEVEDFSTIEFTLNKALSSSNNAKFNNPGQSQVFFIPPDTKVIFNCNNQNSNIPPPPDAIAEEVHWY